MTGGTRIPFPRRDVLEPGTPLQEEITIAVKEEDMDRPVEKPVPMNHAARLLADDLVGIVDHVEQFVLALRDCP